MRLAAAVALTLASMSSIATERYLLDDVADDRTLDEWAHYAGMARRTLMRAFSGQVGMTFGRWRQQARLFVALEL